MGCRRKSAPLTKHIVLIMTEVYLMNNKQVAQKVVDRIVEMIDSGESLPWVKPWNRKVNTVTIVDGIKTITVYPTAWNRKGVQYRGANTYLPVGEYITFKQCVAEGGSIKKGVRGWPVVYWNFLEKEDPDTHKKETIPILKYYTVFNVKDCDGIEQKHFLQPTTVEIPITHEEVADDGNDDLNTTAEAIISDYVNRAGNGFHIDRDEVSHRGAFYSPMADYVSVPMRKQFAVLAEYYSTLFHELGHSTGHSTRLNRFTGKAACATFGSQEYSKEELVAESTAATILNALGMEEANTFRNSAAYIKSWASHIKDDPLMYVSAATKAQAAVDLILGVPAEI